MTAVPGDGIGPEMLEHVKTIFKLAFIAYYIFELDLEILDHWFSE